MYGLDMKFQVALLGEGGVTIGLGAPELFSFSESQTTVTDFHVTFERRLRHAS